MERRFIW